MTKLPISICLFTSTKGHYQRATYADTLRLLNHQIPLSLFGALYAHVKVTPGSEAQGDAIGAELAARGFTVEQTVGDWSRGTSHQQAYLADMCKASQSSTLLSQPYMLLLEDDSPMLCHQADLIACLSRMVATLEANPQLVSTRFIRRGDYEGGVPHLHDEADHFYSPHFDFQPAILRSRDYLIANKVIEDNWARLGHLQCELVMRIALDTLSRAERRHMVWKPDYAETYHIGVPEGAAETARIEPLFKAS